MGKVIGWLFGLIFGFIAAFTFMYFVTGVNQNSDGDLIIYDKGYTTEINGVTFTITDQKKDGTRTIKVNGQTTNNRAVFQLTKIITGINNIYILTTNNTTVNEALEVETTYNTETGTQYLRNSQQITITENDSIYSYIFVRENSEVNKEINIKIVEMYPERVGMLEWFANIVGSFTQENLIDSLKEPILDIIDAFYNGNFWDKFFGGLRILIAPTELIIRIIIWFANIVYNVIPIIFGI